MPGISPINILSKVLFLAGGLKLPTDSDWQQPEEDQYSTGLQEANEAIPGPPSQIPPQFMPQNPNKQHMTACDDRGKEFADFQDAALDAVKFAVDMWKLQAKFKDLKVNAVTALGTPGCLDGPDLDIENAPSFAAMTQGDNIGDYKKAVADGVKKCFKDWQGKVMVPGLPWYPAFAAFPGPMAPPMPNVPMPLIACVSAMMTKIILGNDMKSEMINALPGGVKDKDPDKQHEVLFESIATVLSLAFLMWLPSQQVMLVMGKGPIPTFAPPYVPVGPVVMGDNIAAPGHLMA